MQPSVPQATHVLADFFPVTLEVDGRALQLRVKRFALKERIAFLRDFNRVNTMAMKDKLLLDKHRQTDAEGKPEADGVVVARLELEQAADVREARYARDAEEETFAVDFLIRSITDYVTALPGQVYREADPATSLTAGEDLLGVYGNREDVLQGMLASIYLENCLSEEIKKKLKAPPASAPSSTAAIPTAAGDAPAPTAPPASGSTSAPADAATAAPPATATPLSGATAS